MGVWSFEVGLQLSKQTMEMLAPLTPPKKKRETLFIQKKKGKAEERLLKQWHNCVTW